MIPPRVILTLAVIFGIIVLLGEVVWKTGPYTEAQRDRPCLSRVGLHHQCNTRLGEVELKLFSFPLTTYL